MTWNNRVAWQEGMFLRAQHFQQQDRWVEQQLRSSTTSLCPHPWGLIRFSIAHGLLATGRLGAASVAGLFEDGTPFSLPEEAELPPPIEIPENFRDMLVFLAVRIQQPGAAEIDEAEARGRYEIRRFEAYDTHSGAPEPADLQVGRLRLRYLLETDDRDGYFCIPLVRVLEVTSDRHVVLDERWIPPVLNCAAAPPLASLVVELSGLLHQRGEALAGRLNAVATRNSTEVADFLLLQSVNGWQPLFSHMANSGNVHPETLYRSLLQMAGTFSTFTSASRRPDSYPAYRHHDLQRSFAPVVADIRRSLSAVLEQTAIRIPLQERRHGVRVGAIQDRSLLNGSSFVLVVQADMGTDTLRRNFPSTIKIGAVEHIRELVNVALPGIELSALPVAPRQMPFIAGALYFELDRNSPHWQQMQSSGGFALHVSGEYPSLALDLWAIRG